MEEWGSTLSITSTKVRASSPRRSLTASVSLLLERRAVTWEISSFVGRGRLIKCFHAGMSLYRGKLLNSMHTLLQKLKLTGYTEFPMLSGAGKVSDPSTFGSMSINFRSKAGFVGEAGACHLGLPTLPRKKRYQHQTARHPWRSLLKTFRCQLQGG